MATAGMNRDAENTDAAATGKDDAREKPGTVRERLPLHAKILAGLLSGAALGLAVNISGIGETPLFSAFGFPVGIGDVIAHVTEPVGALFLRLLLMIVLPLVFASLVCGVAGMGTIRRFGRIGLKTLAYTVFLSTVSVGIGISLANLIRPGERMDTAARDRIRARYTQGARGSDGAPVAEGTDNRGETPFMRVVKSIVPANPFAAASGETPNMLHVMFFALSFGLALTLIPAGKGRPLIEVAEAVYSLAARLIDLIMRIAPFAVACLVFNNIARFGLDLLSSLCWYIAVVLSGLAIHMFGVYSLSVSLLARLSPLDFFRRVRTAMLTAFSTSSSSATLPTALRVGERNLGIPPEINGFVLTVGATANQNGTALYEGVTVLFLAQLAGVDLSLGQQVMVAYMAILGGIGTAGVPAGSIPFVVAILAQVNVPTDLIAIVLGVDRILDMCRTTLNVTGDLAAAAYVARSEGSNLIPKGEAEEV
ncbi:MAG: dicarboxylate/amino acid:cation symporter [Planctomycetota bacterium]|nr:dicarboxylate/amino acid:cation symporter [Planctomycetota bacterium]